MKQMIRKIVAYGFVVWFMICAITWITLLASLEDRPNKFDLFFVSLGVLLNIILLCGTLAYTESTIGKKNVKSIVWLMVVFILAAVLYYLLFAPYNHAYFSY